MSRHYIKREESPPGMSSFTRLRMGWIGDDQIVEVTPGETRTVTLGPLGGGKGILAIRIPGRRDTYFLLENRQELPGDPMPPTNGLLVLHVDESREDGDGVVRIVDANPKVPDFAEATFGVSPRQTPSVSLPQDVAVEVLWQRERDIVVMVTKRSNAAEVQAVAKQVREIDQRLTTLPESPASVEARANLTNIKELLVQMKVGDAETKMKNTKWP